MPRGTPARRAGGPVRELLSFVVLVPAADPWIVECYLDHPEVVAYVNIGTVPEITGGEVAQVDLDLDVVLRHDVRLWSRTAMGSRPTATTTRASLWNSQSSQPPARRRGWRAAPIPSERAHG